MSQTLVTPHPDAGRRHLEVIGESAVTQAEALTRLFEACQTVLRLCPDLSVLAIRWMHFKHPLHPVQESLLRDHGLTDQPCGRDTRLAREATPRRGRVALLQGLGRCLRYAVYLSAQLVYLRVRWWRQIRAVRSQAFALVAKTCCFARERFADGCDLYYGDLPLRVAQRGIRMLVLAGDVLDRRWGAFAATQMATEPVWRVPELCLLHPLTPLRLMAHQLVSAMRLRRLVKRLEDPLLRDIALRASYDCLIPDTAFAALNFWMAKRAVQIWHPTAFITFYEGHAWERCAWKGVKAADPSCRTVGYQHAMLFQESLSLTAPVHEGITADLPDAVLCLGQEPLALMRPGYQATAVQLLRFGSLRYACRRTDRPAQIGRRTVLVIPEGLASEAGALFAFAYECAKRLPAYRFIFRMFPNVPLPAVEAAVQTYRAHQPNILLSEAADIQEDYEQSSILLYRASTSVLGAVLNGLLPIWVYVQTLTNTDPLYMMEGWRKRCAHSEEFVDVVEAYEQTPPEQRAREWQAAADYLARYAEPLEERAIDEFLSWLLRGSSVNHGAGRQGAKAGR